MALTGNPTFKKAAARTASSAPTRSVRHSSRPSRAPRSPTSGGTGGRGRTTSTSTGSAPAKKAPSTARQLASPGSNPTKKKVLAKAGPQGKALSQLPDLGAPTVLRRELKAKGRLTASNPRRLLLGEYLVCMTVLGAATIVAPQGSSGGVPRLVIRGSALSALFMVLALVSSAGAKAEKAAAAMGGLVTVTYVVTSKDSVALFTWMAGFFSRSGTGATPHTPTAQAGGALGEAGLILESALSPDHAAAINEPSGAVGDAGRILGKAFEGVFAAQGGSDIAGGALDSTSVGPPDQTTHGGATAE